MKPIMSKKIEMGIMVLSISSSCSVAGGAWGQVSNGTTLKLEEVVVTATKMGARSVQEVPLAITAYTAEALEQAGQMDIADIAASTPGLTYTSNSAWAIISIRGIGTNNVFAGGDADTTLQVDGVYYGRPTGGNLDLIDIERVEVLRGPQGTLYGRNAIAGTINVVTQSPGTETTGTIKYSAGSYGLVRPELSFSTPLVEDLLAVGIAARYNERKGFVKQLNPMLSNQAEEISKAVRGKLNYTPTKNVSLLLSADYNEQDGHFNFPTVRRTPPAPDGEVPSFFETALSHRNYMTLEQWGVSGTLNWNIGDLTLTSITAYRDSESNLEGDLDFTLNELFHTRYFPERQDQFTQEINLNGEIGNLEFVTGVFYYKENVDSFYNANIFNAILATQGIDVTTESVAGFAQGSYRLTERLSTTLGIRYTRDSKEVINIDGASLLNPLLPGGGEPANPAVSAPTTVVYMDKNRYQAWTPKFGLEYQMTENTLAYVSVTKGFKSGGNNLLINAATADGAAYGPEEAWSYELGAKIAFEGATAGTLNAVAFYSDFDGLQVNQFVFLPSGAAQVVSNAEGAIVKGLELELALNLSDRISMGGTLAYLDATYDGAFTVGQNFSTGLLNADGQRLSDAPRWSGNLYTQYEWSMGDYILSLRAEGHYKDEVYYSPENNLLLGAEDYWLANLGLRINRLGQSWEFGVVGRNILEEEYIVAGYYAFSAAGQPGEPRMVDVYIKYSF